MTAAPSGAEVLVTGAAGFLGYHLCQRLLGRGDRVVGLDSMLTGRDENVAALRAHPGFTFVAHDVTARCTDPAVVTRRFSRIYSLACAASPPHYQADPEHTVATCVLGSMNVLALARRHGARVFLASTSEVYGDPLVHPQTEDYRGNVSCTGPRACYDEGKRCAETLFFDAQRTHGTDVRVARIFNTYGPAMDPADGRVVSNFICQALAGEPLTLYGDGSQTRSFCYVDDLIAGFLALMDTEPLPPEPVNLGNPDEFTVQELAARVLALIGSHSHILRRPLPADDPHRRRPDIARAGRLLAWAPRIDLEAGLRQTIAYFASTRATASSPAAVQRAAVAPAGARGQL